MFHDGSYVLRISEKFTKKCFMTKAIYVFREYHKNLQENMFYEVGNMYLENVVKMGCL